jgi:two-component system, OmpR family, sensor kinase
MHLLRWRPRNSLQARLSRSIALAVAVLWLLATMTTVVFLRREMDEVFDSALQELAERVVPLAYQEILNRDQPGNDNRAAPVSGTEEHLTYLVRDASGAVLIRSYDADPAVFPTALATGFQSTDAYRFYTVSAISRTLFVTAAEPLAHRRDAMRQATVTLLWPLVLLLPLCLIGVWFLVRLTLHPVTAFRAEIGARGRDNLNPVHAPDLPQEIAPLAAEVNNLIARLRRALTAERSFTASAAHELRTPVAAALAQTQRLIAELPPGAWQTRAEGVETGLKRLSRLSARLLDLAKAEGAGLLAETGQDVVPVLRMIVQDMPGGERVDLTLPDDPIVSGIDLDAFAILSRNLVENALRHGDATARISVSLTADGRFMVQNAGPTVDADTLARLRLPFERGQTTADGTGLGLVIADAIATGIGTTLDISSPATGRSDGFEVSVQLPDIGAPTSTTSNISRRH